MIEVIPAVNAETFEEVKRRIKLIEEIGGSDAKVGAIWVQIDVADGTFTKNTTWHESGDLLSFETPLKIEAHLMINDIEKKIEEWLISPVFRIIFHLEAAKDPDFVIEKIREAGKEVGIAIGPDVPWTKLVPFFEKVGFFQVLGVYPGLPGQKFQEECYDKIRHLRKECPDCIIEVDGGMDLETARKAREAGANIINAATYIFNSEDIGKAINDLKNVSPDR